MREYNEREAIRNLQTYLRVLSYEDAHMPAPPIDGIFSDVTESSLLYFQEKNQIPATGRADRLTWELLFQEYQIARRKTQRPSPISLFPSHPIGYELKLSDQYILASVIQLLINELQTVYDTLPQLAVTGIMDENTAQAVKAFQELNQLPQTGNVDLQTWERLVEQYHTHASDYIT